uniref:Uncharacterized protein n=1 Tax=Anguilla anguilla TaxID=7936 RepID=A0A0E9VF27_ANGAN
MIFESAKSTLTVFGDSPISHRGQPFC